MSLVENIARRPPSNKDLFREVIALKQHGYAPKEIATKLGRDLDYISAINRLVAHDPADLAAAVGAKRLRITIALLIASSNDPGVQRALRQAYESGALRGARFKDAKRAIARCTAKRLRTRQRLAPRGLTGKALGREYQRRDSAMTRNPVQISFEKAEILLPIANIICQRSITTDYRKGTKYRQIARSIATVGLIEAIVRSGKVSMYLEPPSPTLPPEPLETGAIAGLPAVLTGHYSLTAEVTEDAELGWIPAARVLETLQWDRRLCPMAVKLLSQEIYGLREAIKQALHCNDEVR